MAGWTRISPRAIRSVSSAIAAAELDTEPKTVSVDLGDEHGALVVAVSAPVGVPSLAGRRGARGSTPATILERGTSVQNSVGAGLLELTGSTVGRVDVRFTSARITTRGRVR